MAGKKFSIEAIFSAVDKISAPLAKIKTKLDGVGKGARGVLNGANAAVDKSIKGIGKFSNTLGIAGIASVAGLGVVLKDTIDQGANFERTMTFAAAQFPGMIKQGTKEFEALQAAARKVGDETEFSSQDAAEGLTLLATAGLSAEAAIAALPKVVNFATASKVEFAKASDIANDSMAAFGLRSKDAATNAANMSRVMDVLTRAAADSTTNVEQLYEAVSVGGPIAKTAGISLEQFIGYTEALAGVAKGAEAGTAIRNMFLELGAPSTAAVKGMNALGVSVAKTKDGAIDMTATIGRFAKATSKMTQAQKIQALGNVFGARTIGPFIALMDAGVDKINEFKTSLEGASGTTDQMAKLLGADALGALRSFSSLIDGVKLDVFEAIRPILMDVVKATSEWITANRDLIKTKAAEWLTALRDNLPVIWEWTKRVAKTFAAFVAFAATVKTIDFGVSAIETGVKAASFAVKGWGLAVKAASGMASLAAKGWGLAVEAASGVAKLAAKAWGLAVEAASAVAKLAAKAWGLACEAASVVASAAAKAWGLACEAASVVASLAAKAWGLACEAASVVASLAAGAWALAVEGATLVASGAQAAYAAVVQSTTFTTIIPAIAAQVTAMAPMLAALGAAALAVGGLVLAFSQLMKLNDELAGSGGIMGTVGKMIEMGTFDPFAAHDAAMNEKAREERKKRDEAQMVTPQERAAADSAEATASANVAGTITVAASPGTKASVKTKPRSVPIQVKQSGAFP